MIEQHSQSLPSRPVAQLTFQSLSEYACAKMLEKYAGWKGIEGATFQISVGRAVYDFRIGDTFVEYHPISLRREFITDALKSIMSVANRLPRRDKLQLMEGMTEELKAQYAKRRGQTLAAHPTYSRMELVCVHSAEDFIEKVVIHGVDVNQPDIKRAIAEYKKLQDLSQLDYRNPLPLRNIRLVTVSVVGCVEFSQYISKFPR